MQLHLGLEVTNKGVINGPSGTSREGHGIGYKMALDTKLMTKGGKEDKKKGKRDKCEKEKKMEKRKIENGLKNKEIQKCS